MAKRVISKPIPLRNVRLSFPRLREAERYDPENLNETPKFSASFLLDPSDPQHAETIKQIKQAAKQCITEAWGGKPAGMKEITCFGDGNNKVSSETGEVYEGYADMFFVSAANPKRPLVQDTDGTQVDKDEVEDVLYGGCYVNASIDFWVQDNKFGKALRCQLRGVRKKRDGEAFGGGGVSADELADDDDEDFGDSGLDDDLDI